MTVRYNMNSDIELHKRLVAQSEQGVIHYRAQYLRKLLTNQNKQSLDNTKDWLGYNERQVRDRSAALADLIKK